MSPASGITVNYDKTFNNLKRYDETLQIESQCQQIQSTKTEVVVWVKEESGERFLEVSRVKGLWEKCMTLGFINTLLRYINRGNASERGVMTFLNKVHVKEAMMVRYLNLDDAKEVEKVDQSIYRLNNLSKTQTQFFHLLPTATEKAQQTANISNKLAQLEAERKQVEETLKKAYQERKQAEAAKPAPLLSSQLGQAGKSTQPPIEDDGFVDPKDLIPLPRARRFSTGSVLGDLMNNHRPAANYSNATSYSSSSSSSSGGSSTVFMSSTVNGVTSSYSGSSNGSLKVDMHNGKVTVNGQPVKPFECGLPYLDC